MDVDELERITSLRTAGQKKYPPYLMSQLRWALHCYRWRENLKWSKYPGVICARLGLELAVYDDEDEKQKKERDKNILDFQKGTTQPNDAKKKPGPINAKDPMIWILKGKEPIKEKKIQAYIDFLRKEAPDYVEAFTDEGFSNKFCDFLYGYYSKRPHDEEKLEELSYQAQYIEKYIFITKDRGNGKLSSKEFRTKLNKLSEYGLQDDYSVIDRSNAFETADIIIGLRQIGITPFLNFFVFGTDCLDGIEFRGLEKAHAAELIDSNFSKTKKSKVDHIKCKYLYTGVLCPSVSGGSYVGIAKNKSQDSALVNLTIPKIYNQNTKQRILDLDHEEASLNCEILFNNHVMGLSKARWLYGQTSILSTPYKINFFQNFIATLKP